MTAVADTTSSCIISPPTVSSMPQHAASNSSSSHMLYSDMPASSHSPVPSLTHDVSQTSSASSSVTSLSPGALAVATPRDLMPQFSAALDNPSGDAKKMPSVTRHHHTQHRHSADVTDNNTTDPVGLKRRASSQDDISATATATTGTLDTKRRRTISRKRDGPSSRPPKRLTGSADFVKRFGLVDLYDQFVRPYVSPAVAGAGVRQQMPDLASAYLRNVRGAVVASPATPSSRPLDLMALVMAPPKNEFERLDMLPMASIKAAFSISSGNSAVDSAAAAASKRSRISLKYSTDSPQQQQQQQQQSLARRETSTMAHRKQDDGERRRHQDVTPSSSSNGSRHDHRGHGSGRQYSSPNRA